MAERYMLMNTSMNEEIPNTSMAGSNAVTPISVPTLKDLLPAANKPVSAEEDLINSPYPSMPFRQSDYEKTNNSSNTMKRALLEDPYAFFDREAVPELATMAGESPEAMTKMGTMAMKLVSARYLANAYDLDFPDAMQNFEALTKHFFGEKIDDPKQVYLRLRAIRQMEEGPSLGDRLKSDAATGILATLKSGGIDTGNVLISRPMEAVVNYVNYGFYKPLEWLSRKAGWEWGEKNFGAQTHLNFRDFTAPLERMSDEYQKLIAYEEQQRGPSSGFMEDVTGGVIRNLPNMLLAVVLAKARAASAFFGMSSLSSEIMDTRDNPNMSEAEKLYNAVLVGAAEAIFEEWTGFGRIARKYWGKTIPAGEIKKISTAFGATLARTGKALALDAAGEGWEEVMTGATQRFSNLLFNKDGKTLSSLSVSELVHELCDPMPLEFSVGAVMGGGVGVFGAGHQFRQQRTGAEIQNFRAELIGEAKGQLEVLKSKESLTDEESRMAERLDGAVRAGDAKAVIDLAYEQILNEKEQQRQDELTLDEWASEHASEAIRQEKEFLAAQRAPDAAKSERTRTEVVRGMVEDLQYQYRDILQLEFVPTAADLPESIRNAPNFVSGVEGCFETETGKIYFVGSNLNPGRVQKVFLHEAVGHRGLRGLFGSRYDIFLDQLARDHADEISGIAERRDIDFTTEKGRLEAADEFMATMAEVKTGNPSLWKKVMAAFRAWLRRVPGFRDLRYSDAELETLLDRSARTLGRSGDGDDVRFAAALRRKGAPNHAMERGKIVDGNVPHAPGFMEWAGLDGDGLYADAEMLAGKHNEYFEDQVHAMAATTFVLAAPEKANDVSGNLAFVRKDEQSGQCFRIEIRKRVTGKRNQIRSTHKLNERQYQEAKIGDSPVLQPSPAGAEGVQAARSYSDFVEYYTAKYPDVKFSIAPNQQTKSETSAVIDGLISDPVRNADGNAGGHKKRVSDFFYKDSIDSGNVKLSIVPNQQAKIGDFPVLQPSLAGADGVQSARSYSDFIEYYTAKYPDVKFSIAPEYSKRVKRLAAILTPHSNETSILDQDAAAAILANAGITVDSEADAVLLHDAAWQARELIRERHKRNQQKAEEDHLRKKDSYYAAMSEKYGRDFKIAAGVAYDGTKFSGTWMDDHKLAKNQTGVPVAEAAKILSDASGKEVKESEVVEYFGNLKRESLLKDLRDQRARLRELRNIEDELQDAGSKENPRSLLAERNQYIYDRYPFIRAAIDYGGPKFLIRPSMRYKGETFSGSFISPNWIRNSSKRKSRKTGLEAIEAENKRLGQLENASGIPSDVLATRIAKDSKGDPLTIENEIIDFFRDLKLMDLYREYYAEKRQRSEWSKEENRQAAQEMRELRSREAAESAAAEYKALLDEALRDKQDIVQIQAVAAKHARRVLPKEMRGEFLQRIADLSKYSSDPAPAYPQGRRMYELEKLLEKMQSFRIVDRTKELAERFRESVNPGGQRIAPLGGEAQGTLETIRNILRMPGPMVANQISNVSEALNVAEEEGNTGAVDNLLEELELLQLFGRLDQKTPPEALEAFRALESLIEDKRDSFLAKLKAKREELGRLRHAAVVEITGNKDGLPQTGRNEHEPRRLKWLLEQRNLRGLLDLVSNRSDKDFDDTVLGQLFGRLEQSTWKNASFDRESNTRAEKAIERIFQLDALAKKAAFWRDAEKAEEHTGIFIDRYTREVAYAKNQFGLVDGRGFTTGTITPENARTLLQGVAVGKAQLDPLAAEFLRQQLDDFEHGVIQEYQIYGNPDEDAAFNAFVQRQRADKEPKLTIFRPDPKAEKRRVELGISRADGATLLMAWEQLDVQARMRWNGWSDESIDQLKKFIGRDFMEFAYWSRQEIADKSKALDVKSKAIYGAGLPGLPNYYPVSYKESLGKQVGTGKSDYLGYGYGQMSVNPSFLIKRKFHLSDVDLHRSVFQTHLQHQLEVNHFLSWAESVREARGIFNDKRVRQAISGTYGTEVYNQIIDRVQTLARAGRDSGRAAELMGRLFRYWVPAKIALNFSSVLKQFSGAAAFMNEMPMPEFLANIAETFTDSPEFKKFSEFARNSEYFKSRIQGGFSRDIMYLMKSNRSGKIEDVYGNSLIDKGTYLTRWSDSVASLRGGYALFKHHYQNLTERGMAPGAAWEEATRRWQRTTDETQQSGYLKDQNFYQSQAGFFRYLTSFLSNPIQIMNLELMTIDDIRFGEGKRKEQAKAKLARQLMVNHVIVPTLMTLITQFFRSGFDYDEYEWEDFVTAGLLGPFEGAFIAGKVLQGTADVIADKLLDRASIPGGSNMEAFPMFDESIAGLGRLMKLVDDLADPDKQPDGSEYYRSIQSLADLLAVSGTVAPVPHVGAVGAMGGAMLRELKRFWRLFGPNEPEKPKLKF